MYGTYTWRYRIYCCCRSRSYGWNIFEVEIDFLKSEICDESAADTVKKVVEKLNKKKIKVSLIGARGDSAHLVKNLNKV